MSISKKSHAANDDGNDDDDDDDDTNNDPPPKLSDLFETGQWIRAAVIGVTDGKRLELTVFPAAVNGHLDADDLLPGLTLQVCVSSIQDHGVTVETGVENSGLGFIPNDELRKMGFDDIRIPCLGQIFLTNVQALKSRLLTLASATSATDFCWPMTKPCTSATSLLPGTLVEGLISKVRRNGLMVTVAAEVEASVDFVHSGAVQAKNTIPQLYASNQKIVARIIYLCTSQNEKLSIKLSLLPDVVELTNSKEILPFQELPASKLVQQATVVSVEPSLGLFVDLNIDHEGTQRQHPGFVHISRISEKKIDKLDINQGNYRVGSKHPARILGFSLVDAVYALSMNPRVIEQPYSRPQDLPVGSVITVTVEKVLPHGAVVVKISETMKGLISEFNLSDIKQASLTEKIKPGTALRARVLNIAGRRIYLTLKKSIVEHEGKLITAIDPELVGLRTIGTVMKAQPKGAVIEFFGGVKGFLPVSEMSEVLVQNVQQHLWPGQSLHVRVLSVDSNRGKIMLSRLSPIESEQAKLHFAEIVPGETFLSGSVLEKSSDGLIGLQLDGSTLRAVLSVGHLADDFSKVSRKSRLAAIKTNQRLDNLLVIEKSIRKQAVILTAKPSLIESCKKDSGSLPSSSFELVVGTTVHGYIKAFNEHGVFVSLANGLTGLIPPRDLKNYNLLNPSDCEFSIDDSVTCEVVSIDEVSGKFTLEWLDPPPPANKKAKDRSVELSNGKALQELNKVFQGRVAAVKQTHLDVLLTDKLAGRVDRTHLFDDIQAIRDVKRPLSQFKSQDLITVKVIGTFKRKTHDAALRSAELDNLELSAKRHVLESSSSFSNDSSQILSLNDPSLQKDQKLIGFVTKVLPESLILSLSPTLQGKISVLDLTDDIDSICGSVCQMGKLYPVGSALSCHVKKVDTDAGTLTLTTSNSTINEIEDVSIGQITSALVIKATPVALTLRIGDHLTAICTLADVSDDFDTVNYTHFSSPKIVKAQIVAIDKSNLKVHASLRVDKPSDISTPLYRDHRVRSAEDVHVNSTMRGFVKSVADSGLYVALGADVTGRAMIKNLFDDFVLDWKSKFTVGQLVNTKVLSKTDGRIDLSLRPSHVGDSSCSAAPKSLSELHVNDIIDGTVRRVEEYGLIIHLKSHGITGLCHKSEIADRPIESLSSVFADGDMVKARVLSINMEKRRVALGLKASYFEKRLTNSETEREDKDQTVPDESVSDDSEIDDGDQLESQTASRNTDEEQDSSRLSNAVHENEKTKLSPSSVLKETKLSVGFDWSDDAQSDEKESSDSETSDHERTRKKAKTKKGGAVEDRTGDLMTRMPQSATDFERLLVASPQSSILWVNYMAFHLQLSEIDRAREIAERALKTINFREEDEKLNVWVAFMNLENSFGTKENLEAVFKRATQFMDEKTVHFKLVDIFVATDKVAEATDACLALCKKYGASDAKVWSRVGSILAKYDPTTARSLLDRAFKAVTAVKDKVEIVKDFAQMEYRIMHEPERGRSLFEGLISSYPRRVDLWNVYLDQEIKSAPKDDPSAQKKIAELFERALQCNLQMKQAKYLFKKWLGYVESIGDSHAAETVKARAMSYVKQHSA